MVMDYIKNTRAGKTLLWLGALGTASLMPSTVKDKGSIDDVVAQLQPQNSQTEVEENGYQPSSAIEYAKKAVGPANAYAGGSPRDKKLRQQMSQPVVDTLEGANYTVVNDQNYDKEVYNAESPVMVLFYSDNKNKDGNNPSRGLAALTRSLHEKFPEIKLCTYQVDDNFGKADSLELANVAEEGYNAEKIPALLFYDNGEGEVQYNDGLMGGITKLNTLKENFPIFDKYIPKNILK